MAMFKSTPLSSPTESHVMAIYFPRPPLTHDWMCNASRQMVSPEALFGESWRMDMMLSMLDRYFVPIVIYGLPDQTSASSFAAITIPPNY